MSRSLQVIFRRGLSKFLDTPAVPAAAPDASLLASFADRSCCIDKEVELVVAVEQAEDSKTATDTDGGGCAEFALTGAAARTLAPDAGAAARKNKNKNHVGPSPGTAFRRVKGRRCVS